MLIFYKLEEYLWHTYTPESFPQSLPVHGIKSGLQGKLSVLLFCVCATLPWKVVPEMTYAVSGGTLNPTHSLTLRGRANLQFWQQLVLVFAVKSDHLCWTQHSVVQNDYSLLHWSQLIISKTIRLLDVHKACLFHILCFMSNLVCVF